MTEDPELAPVGMQLACKARQALDFGDEDDPRDRGS